MLLGRKRKQDTAAAAVVIRIQDKRNHVAVGEVRNHEFTIEDRLENSDVESEYEGASNYEEDTDEKENELHPETDADFIQWQPSTSSCSRISWKFRSKTQSGPWDCNPFHFLFFFWLIYSNVLLGPICKSHQLQSRNGGEEQNGHVRKW